MLIVKPKYPKWLPCPFRKGWRLSRQINKRILSILDYSEIKKLDALEGHLHYREGMTLFFFAYRKTFEGRVVEIGSFKGKSTAWIATALKLARTEEKIVAIDPHINIRDLEVVPDYTESTSYDIFLNNLSQLDILSFVEPVRSTSESAAKNWDQQIRFLFIDGSHRYEDVLLDMSLWIPWVNVGGIICMHDSSDSRVHRAIKEYIKSSDCLKIELDIGNLTVLRKIAK